MRTIYRYKINLVGDKQSEPDIWEVVMPYDSRILKADSRKSGIIELWAEVDTEQKKTARRRIAIFGTGNPISPQLKLSRHIDSVIDGPFVWHVFDMG